MQGHFLWRHWSNPGWCLVLPAVLLLPWVHIRGARGTKSTEEEGILRDPAEKALNDSRKEERFLEPWAVHCWQRCSSYRLKQLILLRRGQAEEHEENFAELCGMQFNHWLLLGHVRSGGFHSGWYSRWIRYLPVLHRFDAEHNLCQFSLTWGFGETATIPSWAALADLPVF